MTYPSSTSSSLEQILVAAIAKARDEGKRITIRYKGAAVTIGPNSTAHEMLAAYALSELHSKQQQGIGERRLHGMWPSDA